MKKLIIPLILLSSLSWAEMTYDCATYDGRAYYYTYNNEWLFTDSAAKIATGDSIYLPYNKTKIPHDPMCVIQRIGKYHSGIWSDNLTNNYVMSSYPIQSELITGISLLRGKTWYPYNLFGAENNNDFYHSQTNDSTMRFDHWSAYYTDTTTPNSSRLDFKGDTVIAGFYPNGNNAAPYSIRFLGGIIIGVNYEHYTSSKHPMTLTGRQDHELTINEEFNFNPKNESFYLRYYVMDQDTTYNADHPITVPILSTDKKGHGIEIPVFLNAKELQVNLVLANGSSQSVAFHVEQNQVFLLEKPSLSQKYWLRLNDTKKWKLFSVE